MNWIRIIKWSSPDRATATTAIGSGSQSPLGQWSVTRHLPFGMDIGPSVWRFKEESAAFRQFAAVNEDLARNGFTQVQAVS